MTSHCRQRYIVCSTFRAWAYKAGEGREEEKGGGKRGGKRGEKRGGRRGEKRGGRRR